MVQTNEFTWFGKVNSHGVQSCYPLLFHESTGLLWEYTRRERLRHTLRSTVRIVLLSWPDKFDTPHVVCEVPSYHLSQIIWLYENIYIVTSVICRRVCWDLPRLYCVHGLVVQVVLHVVVLLLVVPSRRLISPGSCVPFCISQIFGQST